MSKTLNKTHRSIMLTGSGVSLFSFTTVIGTPVGIVSVSLSLVFLITNGIVNMFLKTMGNKKNKHIRKKKLYWPGVN